MSGEGGKVTGGQGQIVLGPYEVLLFDMDGTILTSIAAVERAWGAWSARVGANAAEVIAYIHGRTARDTISHFLPSSADIAAEVRWLESLELEDVDGVSEIPGAGAFLSALPPERWAVVTSASRQLATVRIRAAGLPAPKLMVACDDVVRGKPDPEGYLQAARRLGVDARNCLVFEDTEAGMGAGLAAGAQVIQIAGEHAEPHAGASLLVHDYTRFRFVKDGSSISISIEA